MITGTTTYFSNLGVAISNPYRSSHAGIYVQPFKLSVEDFEPATQSFIPRRVVFEFVLADRSKLDEKSRVEAELTFKVFIRDSDLEEGETIDDLNIGYWKGNDWVNFEDEEIFVERWRLRPSPLVIDDVNYIGYFKLTKPFSGDPSIAVGK